jgi:hypothetical protein
MKVKIIKAKHINTLWYSTADQIGKVFEVEISKDNPIDYQVIGENAFIYKEDCCLVKEDSKITGVIPSYLKSCKNSEKNHGNDSTEDYLGFPVDDYDLEGIGWG